MNPFRATDLFRVDGGRIFTPRRRDPARRELVTEIDLTNNTLLALKDVTAGYGDVQVLWGVTFTVREAEIATLVGANGAGKSTALKTISGVVRAAAGQITFAGERIDWLQAHEIAARGIAHVPEGRRLFPLMSVKENLELGAVSKEAGRHALGR